MTHDLWNASLRRRDFLKGSLGVALGATGLGAVACASGTPAAAPSAAAMATAKIDGDLNLFNWSQYLSPDLITGFEAHYGVKVHQTYFDNMQSMMAKLAAGVPYDLTFPTMDRADQLVRANALLPIDHSQLKNWKEVPAYFNDPWYDKAAKYSVPYALWTTGIIWRTDNVGPMTGSWSDLWNHPEAAGKTFLLDDLQETIGVSLLRQGHDINSRVPAEIDSAVQALLELKPRLRGFSTQDITNVVNGDAWIHHAWSGDAWQVLQQVKDPSIYKYETCKEGVPTGNDTMAIPKQAQHPGTALLFIDWMLAPENATTNVKYFGYPQVTTTGLQAFATMAAAYPTLQVNLDTAIHGLREIPPAPGPDLTLWNNAWSKVKAG